MVEYGSGLVTHGISKFGTYGTQTLSLIIGGLGS